MRPFAPAALFAALVLAAPVASAGDFFLNGQAGRMDVDNGFNEDKSQLLQASAGYRWGIGMAQVGVEAGLGKSGTSQGQARTAQAGGYIDHDFAVTSRMGFAGINARVKPPLVPVYLVGRAGVLGMRRELDDNATFHGINTAPVSDFRALKESSGGTYVGLGVGTTILPLLDVGLMVNQYRTSQVEYDPVRDEYDLSGNKRDATSVGLSVEYRF